MNIAKKNLLVKVTVHKYDFKVRDKDSTVEISDTYDVDPSQLDFKKNTMLKSDVGNILKIMGKFRPTVCYYTSPWLDGGWRLLSVDLYETLERKLRTLNNDLAEARQTLLNNWDKYIENSKKKLNGRWREEDYPAADYVASRFSVDVSYNNVPTSGDLRVDMSEDVIAKIKQDMKDKYENRTQSAMTELWDRTVTVIQHMNNKLVAYSESIEQDTRKTPLYESMVENVKDLIQLLPAMNITGDVALEKVRQQIEEDFSNLSIDILKEDDSEREKIIKKTENLLDNLYGSMI